MNPAQRLGTLLRALRRAAAAAIADEAQRAMLPGVRFADGVVIRGADRISTGRGVFIDHRAYLNASTVNARRGYIRLGDCVEIGPYSVLWGGGGIQIGNNVHMGAHVHVTSQQGRRIPPEQTDPHVPLPVDCAPVEIGDHVLIYSGAIVVPGVTIGHHAVIAAGSVVIDDIPPYAVAAGAPARVVRIALRQAQGDIRQAQGDIRQAQGDIRQAQGNIRQAQGDIRQAQGDIRQAQGDGRAARESSIS